MTLEKVPMLMCNCAVQYYIISVCHPVDLPLDVLFILDGSGSVGGETFDLQLKILGQLIDSVEVGEGKTQIAIMQYSSYTFIESLFNTHRV